MISFYQNYSGQTLSKHLGWSHYCELLSISDKDKRSFYEKECSNARMRKFYETYKDLSNLPTALAKLPWSFGVFSFYVNIYALKSKLKKSK
jgi:hypothetical protein